MTVIKICGTTNSEDAICALDAGADMLGFIFYRRSPRYIEPQAARAIVDVVRQRSTRIQTVGVFVNETTEGIREVIQLSGIHAVQLSGDEPLSYLADLGNCSYKAVRSLAQADAILALRDTVKRTVIDTLPDMLLDADHPTLYGGSGTRADESLAERLTRRCRLMLAGGLKPENVSQAIQLTHPWGVDVSSGVEDSPGKKNCLKIRAFIKAVRQQDCATGLEKPGGASL